MERWATFDCYGTLIDWNAGIGAQLERVLGGSRDELLSRYHEVEPLVQSARPGASYREVMAAVLAEMAAERVVDLPESERDALGRSLPEWPAFGDVRAGLEECKRRGWKLAALTNSDRDLIEASEKVIGVPFDALVVASDIGSYKPAHRHWEAFRSRRARTRPATCTSPRASSTTSCPPPSWGSRASGSTASASSPSRRRRASCPT